MTIHTEEPATGRLRPNISSNTLLWGLIVRIEGAAHAVVRFFNLAVDVPSAGLQDGSGKALAAGVKYTLGSTWAGVPSTQQTFAAVASSSTVDGGDTTNGTAAALAKAPFTPPSAPQVFTAFLMGSKGYGYSLLPQLDAPETGPCKPAV